MVTLGDQRWPKRLSELRGFSSEGIQQLGYSAVRVFSVVGGDGWAWISFSRGEGAFCAVGFALLAKQIILSEQQIVLGDLASPFGWSQDKRVSFTVYAEFSVRLG